MKAARTCVRNLLFIFLIFSLASCFHYRVLNTNNDPSTEYEKKVLRYYCWVLIQDIAAFILQYL